MIFDLKLKKAYPWIEIGLSTIEKIMKFLRNVNYLIFSETLG